MEAVFAVIALLFVLFVALGVYATVKVVGAAKRSADRHITQARRTVEDHTLRAKAFAQSGPAGEIAQLRLKLRTSMRATQDALEAAATEDASLKESLDLFRRLSAHGHELEGDLRRLESEPDRTTLAARLPELRERTERITGSADSLRWAVRDRTRRFAEDDLDSLSGQIDMEAGALRHWTTTEAQPAPPRWPEAPEADTARSAGQTWPETEPADPPRQPAGGEPEQDSARAALDPPAPRRAYPWEKKPRPESTT